MPSCREIQNLWFALVQCCNDWKAWKGTCKNPSPFSDKPLRIVLFSVWAETYTLEYHWEHCYRYGFLLVFLHLVCVLWSLHPTGELAQLSVQLPLSFLFGYADSSRYDVALHNSSL